jgi:hypothetical protein
MNKAGSYFIMMDNIEAVRKFIQSNMAPDNQSYLTKLLNMISKRMQANNHFLISQHNELDED